jgi:uncharacterized membrane protein (UPF0127 family)
MKNNFWGNFILIIILFVVGFFLIHSSNHPTPSQGERSIQSVKIAGQNVKVDLALTDREQIQGLSGKIGLGENEGMLFIFNSPGKYPFWMKDMNFPIDIIWLSEGMKVVYIKKDARPELYPETYGPEPDDGNAKYVLEVVSGFSDKNNLKVGDSVEFEY